MHLLTQLTCVNLGAHRADRVGDPHPVVQAVGGHQRGLHRAGRRGGGVRRGHAAVPEARAAGLAESRCERRARARRHAAKGDDGGSGPGRLGHRVGYRHRVRSDAAPPRRCSAAWSLRRYFRCSWYRWCMRCCDRVLLPHNRRSCRGRTRCSAALYLPLAGPADDCQASPTGPMRPTAEQHIPRTSGVRRTAARRTPAACTGL